MTVNINLKIIIRIRMIKMEENAQSQLYTSWLKYSFTVIEVVAIPSDPYKAHPIVVS